LVPRIQNNAATTSPVAQSFHAVLNHRYVLLAKLVNSRLV
jgi:hypothetical protein